MGTITRSVVFRLAAGGFFAPAWEPSELQGVNETGDRAGRAHENYQIKSSQYQRLLLGPAEAWHATATAMLAY